MAGSSDRVSTIEAYQRLKGTLGITGLWRLRVRINGAVWHLDVGSSRPVAAVGNKGWTVHPLKRYVI